jgi:two-component system sensor histidine kinase/response regulator
MAQHQDNSPQAAVNLPDFLARVDNDSELLCELIITFKEKFPHLLQLLRESVALKGANDIENIGHALRGMLACLSATQAAALAGQLEKMGRERKTSELDDALMHFENELARVELELDDYLMEAKL